MIELKIDLWSKLKIGMIIFYIAFIVLAIILLIASLQILSLIEFVLVSSMAIDFTIMLWIQHIDRHDRIQQNIATSKGYMELYMKVSYIAQSYENTITTILN